MRTRIVQPAVAAAVVVAATGAFAVVAASPPDLGPAVVAPAGTVVSLTRTLLTVAVILSHAAHYDADSAGT
ncbi:hypothetical protein [Amycolatopsis sp. NPDC051071]|uniref:hypothetical protein n=1 Tax=Amycolatopsis sp. NPDC051071 TaxID=3154637 RepID=UPI00342980FE